MHCKCKILACVGGAVAWLALPAPAIQLDFASLSLTSLSFDGTGNFGFMPLFANQFRITASDGVGDSINDLGMMNGTWHIGPVSSPTPGEFQANVTGSGTLVIHGGGSDLTGSLTWDIIETKGSSGVLNLNGVLNLSGLTYTGPQVDLLQLATDQAGKAQENLQFSTTEPNGAQVTLLQLVTGTALQSSFSGKLVALPQVRVPDGGSGALLLGSVLLGVEGLRRKLKR